MLINVNPTCVFSVLVVEFLQAFNSVCVWSFVGFRYYLFTVIRHVLLIFLVSPGGVHS